MPSINLMPAPAFDKSLVPAFSTNFNRIRNALGRTTNTYIHVAGGLAPVGGYPLNVVVAVPFKADIMTVWAATCWSTAIGLGGLNPLMDGGLLPHLMDQFWNVTNQHTYVHASNLQRGVAAGNHTYTIQAGSASISSDGGDRWRIAFTMVEVG